MSGAVPEVCKRQRGAMHISALRRCALAILHIQWRGNVLRLRRTGGRGTGAVWGVEGSDPRGTGARFGRGAVRVFTRSSPPPAGVAPLHLSLQEGSQRRLAEADQAFADRLQVGRPDMAEQVLGDAPVQARL